MRELPGRGSAHTKYQSWASAPSAEALQFCFCLAKQWSSLNLSVAACVKKIAAWSMSHLNNHYGWCRRGLVCAPIVGMVVGYGHGWLLCLGQTDHKSELMERWPLCSHAAAGTWSGHRKSLGNVKKNNNSEEGNFVVTSFSSAPINIFLPEKIICVNLNEFVVVSLKLWFTQLNRVIIFEQIFLA
jgi:hypothetical protein